MMYVGFACMVLMCYANYPNAWANYGAYHAEQMTFTGGQPWTVIVSFFILGAWTIVDPAFHQRVASAASPSVGRKGLLVSIGFWFLFDLLSISSAMYALALLDPNLDKLAIYPALAEKVLPSGLKGLFLCGIAGTVMTAMVGYTLVSGATLGREVVARLSGPLDDARVNRYIKVGLIVAIAIAVPIGLSLNSVVDLWYAWAGVSVGALLLPMLIAYRKKASSIGKGWVFASMLIAGSSAMGWLIYCQRTNNAYYDVVLLKLGNGWKLALPPVPENLQGQSATFSLGTLLPGLVISAVILSVGWIAGRRNRT
ncbi:MAG TPA: hypothetical protein VK934_13530, partial [Fimbriimonas sp.]|nr:hypothetical protein [Fimbriimonas sp.]